jgi:hypothetical protein
MRFLPSVLRAPQTAKAQGRGSGREHRARGKINDAAWPLAMNPETESNSPDTPSFR